MSAWEPDANVELDVQEFCLENGSQKIKGRRIRVMQECDACLIPVKGVTEEGEWDGKSLTL